MKKNLKYMTSILYYSNYCDYCKKLIVHLSRTKLKKKIHFVNIDNRYKEKDKTYILLPNGQTLSMPPHVNKVPALMLLDSYNVMYGQQIYKYLKPEEEKMKQKDTMNNDEPLAFSVELANSMSDTYSFLDMTSDELSAKGSGGFRQMHNFSKLHQNDTIETPTEDYEPDKIKNVDLSKLQEQRLNEIKM